MTNTVTGKYIKSISQKINLKYECGIRPQLICNNCTYMHSNWYIIWRYINWIAITFYYVEHLYNVNWWHKLFRILDHFFNYEWACLHDCDRNYKDRGSLANHLKSECAGVQLQFDCKNRTRIHSMKISTDIYWVAKMFRPSLAAHRAISSSGVSRISKDTWHAYALTCNVEPGTYCL